MSNFLNTLISRENGRAAHAVAPRLPSRYEPREQKAPFPMHETVFHHETVPTEPGWEASRAGMASRDQEFNEVPAPQPHQPSDLASTHTQQHQKKFADAGQHPISAVTTVEYEVSKANTNIDTGRSPGTASPKGTPIHGRKVSDPSENATQTHHASTHQINELVKPTVVSAAKGTAQVPWNVTKAESLGISAKAFASSESEVKPLLEPETGMGESEARRSIATVSSPATPPVPPLRQISSVVEHESKVSSSIPVENSRSAVSTDEAVSTAKSDDKQRAVKPRISSRISSSDGTPGEGVQHDGKPMPSTGLGIPPQMLGQNGNAPGLLDSHASSLLLASAGAALRARSTPTLSPQRESGTASKVTQPEPTINVSIGRIEVRAVMPPAAPKRSNQTPKPMSLDDYLNKSSQRERR